MLMQTFVKPVKIESFNLTLTHLKNAHRMTWAQLAKRTGVASQTISKYRTAPLSMPMGMVNNFRFAMDLDMNETEMIFEALRAEIDRAWPSVQYQKTREIQKAYKQKAREVAV
jgi:transcriptional regulator with XRE-family HTH domain